MKVRSCTWKHVRWKHVSAATVCSVTSHDRRLWRGASHCCLHSEGWLGSFCQRENTGLVENQDSIINVILIEKKVTSNTPFLNSNKKLTSQ